VSDEAVDHHEAGQDSAGNVRGLREKARVMADQRDQYRKRKDAEENASAVHRDATKPFPQVVALGFEDEPLISEE
jgi:hypothetical protein